MKKNRQTEETFGSYDDRGHWKPPYPCSFSPLFSRGFSLKKLLKFLFGWGGYLYPRHVFYTLLAVGTFFLLKKDIESFEYFSFGFIGLMLLRNLIMVVIIYGGYNLLLYRFRVEGNKKKYHPDWLQNDSKKFIFGKQLYDNMFRACVVGVTTWTAYEIAYIWMYSKGLLPFAGLRSNPVWFFAFFLIIPLIRETHFYIVHKILHTQWMMKHIHKVHHMNPNPGPWSGLAMHPIEMILYFSVLAVHLIIPSHPIHFFYNAQLTALTPAQGHSGFEGPLLKGWLPVGDYFHYLHHKYVACNFGGPTIPWDKWFGIFYDGEGKFVIKKVKLINRSKK